MSSLFDDLNERLAADPSLLKRGGPRVDLSMLLFNAREDIAALWDAADRVAAGDESARDDLAARVEKLRPIFGNRD